MNLRQLEIFCKVIELGSFSKAGEATFLSQPTISEHIKTLEEDLSNRLIDRMGREIILTKAGEILYEYAKKILDLSIEARQAVENFSGNMTGEITVGGSNIPGEYVIPCLLGKFKETYPNISLLLRVGDTREIINEVLHYKIELGIVGAKIEDKRLQYKKFMKDELVLIIPPSHPWGSSISIRPEELQKEPFVLRERGSGSRMTMEKALHDVGIDLSSMEVVAEMGSTEAIRQGIKSGVGVSVLSRISVQDELKLGMLREVRIEGLSFVRYFYMVFHKGRSISPLVEAFIDFLMDNVSME